MNRSNIMVSVIVLTYNHACYISQCLNSILMQTTNFSYEILIGDDASNDGTSLIVKKYILNYPDKIRGYIRPKNIGATSNLYDLQTLAQGTYLAYLEGDDYWCDEYKLQKQIDFLLAHPQYIGCTHQCNVINHLGQAYKHQNLSWISKKRIYTLKDFHGIVLPGHMSTLMHFNLFYNSKETYRELITLHPIIGDRSLCLLLASQGPLYQLSEAMSSYRYSRTPQGNNATAIVYIRNPNRTQEEYFYTKKLEAYARQTWNVDDIFSSHKKSLFVSAVWEMLRCPTSKNIKLVFTILHDEHTANYLFTFPIEVLRKLIKKLKLRS